MNKKDVENKNKELNITNVINVFETFAGIGSQHKAIRNSKKLSKKFCIKKISDWDARANISYALIHHKNKFDREIIKLNKLTEEENR